MSDDDAGHYTGEDGDEPVQFRITASQAGQRLDAVAASLFDNYSRNRLQSWISEGYLTLN